MSDAQPETQAEYVTGVPNTIYDLITLIHNKLQGVAALEQYKRDAQSAGDDALLALFEDLQRRDQAEIDLIDDYLRAVWRSSFLRGHLT